MMAKWRLLVIMVLGRIVCLFGEPFPCKAGQIHWKPNSTSGDQYKCLECPYCFKGQEPSVPCGSSVPYKTPVDCVECQSGKTYSDADGKEQCKACRMCSGKAIKKNCTVSSNTECDDKCLPGYYEEPFIFGCHPCTDCCNDEKDEIAQECANSEKKCKVRSTPCSRESKRSNSSETVRLKVSTTSPTTYKKSITSDPTWLESKPEEHTSNVLPTLSGNNLVVDSQTKAARSHNQNTNGNDNVLLIVCTVCAAFATIGIIVLVAFKLCRRINADTVLARCNRNSNDDSAVDDIELCRPLTSASQEELNQDDVTLTELESNNQGVFDEMCSSLDNGRSRFRFRWDYERLAACYKGIPLEVRNALHSEHLTNRSPSKMLMNHLQTKYPNLPLRHFVWTLKEIGRNDLVEKLKPYVKKNVNSPPA